MYVQTKVPSKTATDHNTDNKGLNGFGIPSITSIISSGSTTTNPDSPSLTKPFRSIAGIQIEIENIDIDIDDTTNI